MKLAYLSCVCAGLVLAGAAAKAGTVNVVYVHPETYTDANDDPDQGNTTNLQAISDYFQWLGQQYLPADQSLQLEVLNIDLAGKPRFSSRWGTVRVVGRPLDWPQMTLRYRLESDDKVLASAEESVSDMAYAMHLGGYRSWEALPYEKQMLKDWFRQRFPKN